jgi:predicted nucleotidyltransferase
MNRSDVGDILREYKEGLEGILGDRLREVILYGSRARGDPDDSSDIDVLCVMRGSFDYGEMIKLTSELTARLSLKYEVVLSRVFVSESDYQARNLPFFMNVRREGISL